MEKETKETATTTGPKVVVVETEARSGTQRVLLTSRIWQFPEEMITAEAAPISSKDPREP